MGTRAPMYDPCWGCSGMRSSCSTAYNIVRILRSASDIALAGALCTQWCTRRWERLGKLRLLKQKTPPERGFP